MGSIVVTLERGVAMAWRVTRVTWACVFFRWSWWVIPAGRSSSSARRRQKQGGEAVKQCAHWATWVSTHIHTHIVHMHACSHMDMHVHMHAHLHTHTHTHTHTHANTHIHAHQYTHTHTHYFFPVICLMGGTICVCFSIFYHKPSRLGWFVLIGIESLSVQEEFTCLPFCCVCHLVRIWWRGNGVVVVVVIGLVLFTVHL